MIRQQDSCLVSITGQSEGRKANGSIMDRRLQVNRGAWFFQMISGAPSSALCGDTMKPPLTNSPFDYLDPMQAIAKHRMSIVDLKCNP